MKRLVLFVAASLLATACQDAPDTLTGPTDRSASPARSVQPAQQAEGHIVLLDPAFAPDGPEANRARAAEIARELGVEPNHAYGAAVYGFSGVVPDGRLRSLERDPRVVRVEAVEVWELAQQAVPTGVDRIEADQNPGADIDGADDARVAMDIAIIDTGIADHADLNIGQRVSFAGGDGSDGNGHGTHVAGTAAALDNGVGVAGTAPGATVHGAKVCKNGGMCFTSDIVAGIDWVAEQKSTGAIDFASANMSIGTRDEGFTCSNGDAGAVHRAICGAVSEGVVFVIAGGNDGREKVAYPEAFAVSAIADFDGAGGGAADPTCRTDQDDTRAGFSNWGASMDVAAPGTCIRSTWNDGGYNTISGTSMAAPHAAGAVALYLHANGLSPAGDAGGVQSIEQAIRDAALPYGTANHQCSYDNDSADQSTEGLLFTNGAAFGGTGACDMATTDTEPVTDVATTAVDAPTSVTQGDVASVNVTVENVGTEDVTADFTVTLADDTDGVTVGSQTVSGGLTAGASTTVTYSWDTSGASTGDHTLTGSHDLGDDDASNDSKSATVTVNEPSAGDVAVTSITPSSMPAGTTETVTVGGSGFVSGADLTFENGSGPAPDVSNVTVTSSTELTATVTAKSGGPPRERVWDVRVTNPDGSSGVLVGGFTVTP